MLKHLRTAHMQDSLETVSTSGWIAQRVLIVVTAVVFAAPFYLLYAGY
jgi:hypothetical protein